MNFDLFKDMTINGQAVVQLSLDGNIVWKKGGEEDETTQYFNIEALEDGTIGMSHYNNIEPNLYYSTDNVNWNRWDYSPISVNTGNKVYFRGVNTKISSSTSNYSNFYSTCRFKANGNIMSLLYGDDFKGQVSLSGRDYCFCRLFYNSKIVKSCVLPATTLADRCYQSMFQGCTSLTTATELPATTLASYCYSAMFSGCTSLVNAPTTLPATTLTNSCYISMFYNCTSLTTAPELPATTLADSCYNSMFGSCTSLTTTAPELPATTLASKCYQNMFYNCTSLTTAPELPATTLASKCYDYMFNGCTKLNSVKCMAKYTSAGSEITNSICPSWLNNVSSAGIFYKNPEWSGPTARGANTIPTGWTIVDWIK